MLFSKTLKLLICFVMIFPYLLNGSGASAASNYNHAELMDYEGYGEAMYKSLVEETTFITGEYTENKEYVNKSINEIKDYAKFWWEENKVQGEGVGEKLKDVFVKGAAYTLTVGDWVKKFFGDYDTAYPEPPEVDYSPYEVGLQMVPGTISMTPKPGFYVVASYGSLTTTIVEGKQFNAHVGAYTIGSGPTGNYYYYQFFTGSKYIWDQEKVYGSKEEIMAFRDSFNSRLTSVSSSIAVAKSLGYNITLYHDGKPQDISPISRPNNRSDFLKYINDEIATKPIRTPEPKPSLTCPSGEKINLTVDGSTFLNSDGTVMLVNKDGTATVNGTSCALQWQTPEMGYVDDKPAMTDPQGNWLDMITGEVLECVLEGGCVPTKPDEDDKEEEVEELDNSLIEYVKNAYEYATGVLKTATDGLKSLATGAKDLTALFGTFFSWLPKEMVVLMSSGLGIAIGLRLFRK